MKELGICGICHKDKQVEKRSVYIPELRKYAVSKEPFCDECFTPTLKANMEKPWEGQKEVKTS